MEPLRVLLIGNGGREHALTWKLSQSPRVETIIVVPGNGGTAGCPKATNNSAVSPEDFAGLVRLARERGVNLVVPGPEAPLVAGIQSYFERHAGDIAVFGPSAKAARMEGSKTFSKDFMQRHGIPTASYANFSDHSAAVEYVRQVGHDVVIKATGLAAGKGVIIPSTKEEAEQALKEIMLDKAFGSAGDEVVVEEFLQGDELSILTFCDGYTFRSLPAAQDHKRIFDGDKGPNTGGMGCYAPTRIATPELLARIDREILEPTFRGMRAEHMAYRGILFTGLMITPQGDPKVLEYNVRFGDPEAQTVLPLLSPKTDLASVMEACARGYLDAVDIDIDGDRFSATVVAAAGGYPGSYAKGTPMNVSASLPAGVNAFHAGTALSGDGKLVTSGGRVIAVNATAGSLEDAVKLAYEGIKHIQFDGMQYRKDIAHRAFRKEKSGEGKGPSKQEDALTYAASGVNIDTGNAFVERIKAATASTARPGADGRIGGFGGELDLSAAGYPGAPVLVGAIDGVGTKLMVAQATGDHSTVGIDLVAMNVNDLVVQGAEPLMFLDYFGCSRLLPDVAAAFVEGVARGCRDARCALVGGETAEMPGMYSGDDYDAAGAAVGVVRPANRLPRTADMLADDVLVGLASSGVHSNGFSLIRKIVERAGLSYSNSPAPWAPDTTVGQSLLTPTRIYVRALLDAAFPLGTVKGLAHVTGGGLIENIPRMLPEQLAAEVDMATWSVPPVFRWLQKTGNVAPREMCRTFNNGIGMVAVVGAGDADALCKALRDAGEHVCVIGKLIPRGKEPCVILNADQAFATE